MASLITLTDVKSWLTIPAGETEHNARLEELIDDLVIEAEQFLDAKLEPVISEIIYLNGGTKTLILPHLNIGNVTVWEDLNRVFADIDLISSDYLRVDCERGIVRRVDGISFVSGVDVIKVRYDGGYTPPSLPKDLKRALIKQIGYEFRRRKDPGLSSVTYPDGTVNKFSIDEWLPAVEAVLDRYKRMAI